MKNDNMKGKTNKLRRFLPVLALVAGLAVPVVAYADNHDCQDCLTTCGEFYQSMMSGCYPQGQPDYGCITYAENYYSWCTGQCYTYVCQG